MVAIDSQIGFQDHYEYHGSTTIERRREKGGVTIWRDWIIFDTVEDAVQYFNDNCQYSEGACLNGSLI